MTGRKITLPKGFKLDKQGKLVAVQHYRDASHAIRCKTSKKVRVGKRSPA